MFLMMGEGEGEKGELYRHKKGIPKKVANEWLDNLD